MSIPFMDEKLGMYYNFFSKDINKIQYEKKRFELELRNNTFNILYLVNSMKELSTHYTQGQ